MKKAIRILALVGIIGLILTAVITSTVKPVDVAGSVWNDGMILGNPETSTRHYVVYTDLMCPYCNYYARVIAQNEEEVKEFLAEHKITYEVRVTDMLYEGSGVDMSRPAAEGAYCAAKEGKFWEYYHEVISRLFKDYYSRGIGNSKTAPAISDMTNDYFESIAKDVGIEGNFKKCYDEHETVTEIQENTNKAAYYASGLPTFAFENYNDSGFDSNYTWVEVKEMFKAGL